MVEAVFFVISQRRLAARPVGAAKMMSPVSLSVMVKMALVMVLLPVPGPPVMMCSFFVSEVITACFCISAKLMLSFSSTQVIALSVLISRMVLLAFAMRAISRSIPRSQSQRRLEKIISLASITRS